MKLFILTLTWNNYEKLNRLKKSLIPNLSDIDYEWIIKSNGCSDATVDMVSKWQQENDKIKLIAYPNNTQSFSKGMNYCFESIDKIDLNKDLVLLLNNDITFNDNKSIKNMISIICKKNVGMVGAKLKYTDSGLIQHAGVAFNAQHLPFHIFANQKDNKVYSENREFQAVTGAVMLFKANTYKEHPLDEKFVWGYEDINAALNIHHNLKQKVICCGSTNISHDESASLKKNPIHKLSLISNYKHLMNAFKDKIIIDKELYINNKYNIFKD